MLFEPFIESALYAALYRNYFWQHIRNTTHDTSIKVPEGVRPYRSKSDQILDKPRHDSSNFGRLARTGMMDAYMQRLDDLQLCGIKTAYWREFLKAFQESTTDVKARTALERLKRRVQEATDIPSPRAKSALAIVEELERLLEMT